MMSKLKGASGLFLALGIGLTGTALVIPAASALAQDSHEVAQYRSDMLNLVMQCPTDSTNFDQNLAQCLAIEQKLKDRRAAATTQWQWADDRLKRMLWLLEGRIVSNYFRRDKKRSAQVCHHTEKAWLNLSGLSATGKEEYERFPQARDSVSKVIIACREEYGAPNWAAPHPDGAAKADE